MARTIPLAACGLALLALLASGFLGLAARVAAARLNRVRGERDPVPAGERALRLHRTLRIVDLHDDLLLWDRDPLPRASSGHTDVARLRAGNVAVEIFSAVTQVPRGLNYLANRGDTDDVTLLALASRWPPRTWRSLRERALHQAAKLRDAADRSGGALVLATSRDELARALELRARQAAEQRPVIGLLSTEGLQALEGKLENLDALYAAGFRAAGLVHFTDNEAAGSAHGTTREGLTAFGRAALGRMEELHMLVDLAHASPAALEEALDAATRPVLVSHTGVRAVCPGPRNLSDAQLQRLAANGALVGIGYWDGAVCDASPRGIARSLHHAVRVLGPEHVALGSDWDGATTVPFDAAGLPRLTQALLDEGLSEAEIRAIMGESALAFLLAHLP